LTAKIKLAYQNKKTVGRAAIFFLSKVRDAKQKGAFRSFEGDRDTLTVFRGFPVKKVKRTQAG
jgi:hypothetical protein